MNIIKKDKETNKILQIEGIEFNIYKEDGTFIMNAKTDKNGEIKIKSLPIGNYILKENDKQVIDGYEVNNESILFSLKDSKEIKLEFFNEPKKGKIEIIKTSEDGKFLENIKFGLYNEKKN